MIFKALSSTGLKDGLKLLAHQGLQRLQALHAQTHFKPDDLETLGTLAAGLLPLVRAPELKPYGAPHCICSSGRSLTWHARSRTTSMFTLPRPGPPRRPGH